MARTMNADAHQARRFPLRHLTIGRRQTQLTSGGASGLPVGPPVHSPHASRDQELPSQYIKDNMSVTTSGNFSDAALLCALLTLGADRILFLIDHPYQRMADGVQFVESAPINDADKAKIAIKVPSGCSNGERFEDLNRYRLERAGKTSVARTGC